MKKMWIIIGLIVIAIVVSILLNVFGGGGSSEYVDDLQFGDEVI